MKIKPYIFNYCRYFESFDLLSSFESKGLEAKVIDCHCGSIAFRRKPKHFDNKRRISLPNVGYSGQWNAMLNDLNGEDEVVLLINSDVKILNLDLLLERMERFYSIENSGIYAPNVSWTSWTFLKKSLDKFEDFHIVPATDSMIWSLRKDIAFKVGEVDLSVNKWGWGIEVVASYLCNVENKLVVRDYEVLCKHPKDTSYSNVESRIQMDNWFNSFEFSEDLWKHFYSRNNYGFGSGGISIL